MTSRIITLLLGLLLCLFVYPSSFVYPKDTLPDNNDTRLIAYIIGQAQNNILERKNLYQATFFAPEPNTLTYSDLFLTTSILTLPTRLFTNNPILVFNIGFILSFTLTFFTSFLFFQKITKGLFGTIIATLIFNLSSIHLHYYSHLQVFSFWIFFVALYNLICFLESQQQKHLHLFLIFTTLQLAETIFTTYLLFFASLFVAVGKFIKHRGASQNRTEHAHAPSVAREYGFWRGSSLLVYPIVWIVLVLPYAKTHFLYHEATRSIRDAAHFSLGPEELFTKYQSWATITILAVILFHTTTHFLKKASASSKNRTQADPASYCSVGSEYGFLRSTKQLLIFSIIMSLGPVLKIFGQTLKPFQNFGIDWPVPLPYTLFYYLFPGFSGFRTPSRFIILALFAICIMIAVSIEKHYKGLKNRAKIYVVLIVLTLLALENRLPLTGFPVNINPPTIYQSLQNLPDEAIILELPIKLWNMPDHQIESIRSLYSLQHKHKRLNGYSGFATLEWIKLVEDINAYGTSNEVLQKLKSRGVTHIIQNNILSQL